MKNHFIFSYSGNKRNEVANLYITAKDIYKFDDAEIIIEPYCGSCAFSYYISTLYPKKFKYILNDNDVRLYELFLLIQNEKEQTINDTLNELINEFNKYTDDITRKNYYSTIVADKEKNIYSWLFVNKYCTIRKALYPPITRIKQIKKFKIEDIPFYNFVKTEKIEFLNCDSLDILKKYKDNDKTIIFLDPPYISSCNSDYRSPTMSSYEYIFLNNIKYWGSSVICCFENTWIIKLLFKNNTIHTEYNKKYSNHKKKETTHVVITK